MANRTPDMLIHIKSHLKQTAHLTRLEHGAYFLLMMNYWGTGHPLNSDDERMARIVSLTLHQWLKIRDAIAPFFVIEDGLWRHIELDDQLARRGKSSRGVPLGRKIERPKIISNRPPVTLWLEIRERIFKRDDYTCQYCFARGVQLECDHVHPVSRGGGHEDENLVTACKRCNRSKMAKTVEEWRAS